MMPSGQEPDRVVAGVLGGVVGEAGGRVAGLGNREPVGGRACDLLLLPNTGGVADGPLVGQAERGPLRELDQGLDTLATTDRVEPDAAGVDGRGLADGEALSAHLSLSAFSVMLCLTSTVAEPTGLPFFSR